MRARRGTCARAGRGSFDQYPPCYSFSPANYRGTQRELHGEQVALNDDICRREVPPESEERERDHPTESESEKGGEEYSLYGLPL